MSGNPVDTLLGGRPGVINIGLRGFAETLAELGADTVHVDWSPPAGGDPRLAALLAGLDADSERIDAANAETLQRLLAADPVLVDVLPAGEAMPELGERMILHAGPPIAWERMCGPLRGAIAGIAVFEGWASDLAEADRLAAGGAFAFHPNHHFGAVGPMTGVTTRGQMVLVVENRTHGNRAFCAINEGLGRVLRFGANGPEVLDRLRWLRDELGPALARALRQTGGVELKPLTARGLSMGDEMHQRNVACSGLLLRALAPSLAATAGDTGRLARALAFIAGNDQFYLNVAMAMGKAITDAARDVARSSVVTALCRNGTEFGIRVAGTGDRWFTAPVAMPEGLYFPGYSEADANPDIGDSAIVETVGLGGFAMGAAPAVAGFVGAGAASEAGDHTRRMGEITAGRNPEWTIPPMDYLGVPTGIDIRRVVETGILPTINTGIAHRQPGIGQVGAGVVHAPMACFEQALAALAKAAA